MTLKRIFGLDKFSSKFSPFGIRRPSCDTADGQVCRHHLDSRDQNTSQPRSLVFAATAIATCSTTHLPCLYVAPRRVSLLDPPPISRSVCLSSRSVCSTVLGARGDGVFVARERPFAKGSLVILCNGCNGLLLLSLPRLLPCRPVARNADAPVIDVWESRADF